MLVVCAIVVLYGVVDALSGFLYVQLTVVAILVLAFEVVDAERNVAGLLYLGEEASCPYAMDTS